MLPRQVIGYHNRSLPGNQGFGIPGLVALGYNLLSLEQMAKSDSTDA